jgi:1-phosphofructokinase family hexose kinase
MILTVTLNPTIDIVAPVDDFIRGSVMRTKTIYTCPGGKGMNVSRALSSLGVKTVAAGLIGIRDSLETEHFLRSRGVVPSFIPCSGSNRICLLITETGKGRAETVINSESDIDITSKEKKALLDNLYKLSKKASHVIFSGSLPLSLPADFYKTAIKTVRNNSAVILDTSSKYLFHGISAAPQIIKQNIHEFESAFGIRLSGKKTIKTAVSSVSKKYGVPVIIITMNEKGSLLFDRGSFVYYPAISVKGAISPVGSGDAYCAGLAYGLSKGSDCEQACKWAAACSTANLTHLGACFIDKRDVLKLLKRVSPEKFR